MKENEVKEVNKQIIEDLIKQYPNILKNSYILELFQDFEDWCSWVEYSTKEEVIKAILTDTFKEDCIDEGDEWCYLLTYETDEGLQVMFVESGSYSEQLDDYEIKKYCNIISNIYFGENIYDEDDLKKPEKVSKVDLLKFVDEITFKNVYKVICFIGI